MDKKKLVPKEKQSDFDYIVTVRENATGRVFDVHFNAWWDDKPKWKSARDYIMRIPYRNKDTKFNKFRVLRGWSAQPKRNLRLQCFIATLHHKEALYRAYLEDYDYNHKWNLVDADRVSLINLKRCIHNINTKVTIQNNIKVDKFRLSNQILNNMAWMIYKNFYVKEKKGEQNETTGKD